LPQPGWDHSIELWGNRGKIQEEIRGSLTRKGVRKALLIKQRSKGKHGNSRKGIHGVTTVEGAPHEVGNKRVR